MYPNLFPQTIRRSQAHTGVINLNPINKSQQSRDRAQQARDRARQAAIGRDSPANRRKTESGATFADNRKSDAVSIVWFQKGLIYIEHSFIK